MENFVLTDSGFKEISKLTAKDNVYTSESDLASCLSSNVIEISNPENYSYITTTLMELPVLVFDTDIVEVVNDLNGIKKLQYNNLDIDNWLRYKWINRSPYCAKTSIDFKLSTDAFCDLQFIYLFNKPAINKVVQDLNVPKNILKELLISESVDYEHYIPDIHQYVISNLSKSFLNPLDSFNYFKQFILNNYVDKIQRRVTINNDFLAFCLLALKSCYLYSHQSELLFTINLSNKVERNLYVSLKKFLKKLKVSYQENSIADKIISVSVLNKVLFDYVNNTLLNSIDDIKNSYLFNQTHFIENFFKIKSEEFECSLQLALNLKELFLYHNQLISITPFKDDKVIVRLVEDDFDSFESNIIIEDDCYYTRVTSITKPNELVFNYPLISTKANNYITMCGTIINGK